MVMLCGSNLCYCFNGKRSGGKRSGGMGMLQSWNSKHTSAATTIAATVAVLLTSYFGLAGVVQATEVRHPHTQHDTGDGFIPTGKGWGKFDPSGMAFARANRHPKSSTNGISYHGGPLLNSSLGVNVYYIWYGNWSGNSATSILTNLAQNIGGHPYFNINTTYYDGSNTHVANVVTYPTQNGATDSYSHGTALSDSAVQAIVSSAISSGKLPSDSNGVYFVLTSADVNETSGFCTAYCGWHTHGSIGGIDIKYSFVGNPDRCPSACEAQTSSSPNGNTGADGMANVIAHELEEATTDPELSAWFDNRGYENADKCAWKFGSLSTLSTAPNGSVYNVTFGSYNYLIQMNWVNASGGSCAIKY
jgi:hypothetical protein